MMSGLSEQQTEFAKKKNSFQDLFEASFFVSIGDIIPQSVYDLDPKIGKKLRENKMIKTSKM